MFCLHRWTKWRTYTARYILLDRKTGRQYDNYEKHQERTCTRCGRLQDREV